MKLRLEYYAKKFSKLNTNKNKSRGIAPHKPILLLSVIELIGQGFVKQNRIFLSPELIAAFLKYWSFLGSDLHRSIIYLPFFHLKSEGFWHLAINPNLESFAPKFKPSSLNTLQEFVKYAYLDEELFEILQDPIGRSTLVNVVTSTYFADKTRQIEDLFQINSFKDFQDRLREQGGKVYTVEELADEGKSVVRDAAFREVVISIYDHRCAFCHLRVISSNGQNIVDGSHIKRFSEFRDDRIDNGLSLCKNHHWAFDRGWFTINDDYKILVAGNLNENSPNAKLMRDFHGQVIALPAQQIYFPRLDALKWHRETVFAHNNQIPLT
jgi:putative restriction endonuclease